MSYLINWTLIHGFSVGLSIGLQFAATGKKVVGHGKYITLPMVVMWARWRGRKLARKHGNGVYQFNVVPSLVRAVQLFIIVIPLIWLITVDSTVTHVPVYMYDLVYFWPCIALYGDDLLSTIDKDKWKKRWSSAKNKVQWKMKLPVLQPVPTGG